MLSFIDTLAFWSSNFAGDFSNFLGGPIQTFEGASGLAFLIAGYRILNCHQSGCKRIGRFRLGHLRLCHKHHPLVPDDGVITSAHIDAALARVSSSDSAAGTSP